MVILLAGGGGGGGGGGELELYCHGYSMVQVLGGGGGPAIAHLAPP